MTRNEKIEFARLYFGENTLHDDFEILETAHHILRSIPQEIETPYIYRMIYSLLEKRGVFPNLRHINIQYFPLIIQAFASLFSRSLLAHNASHLAYTDNIPYDQALQRYIDTVQIDASTSTHTALVELYDYVILFNAQTENDITSITTYPHDHAAYETFISLLDFIILEKKYISVKNFNLLHIYSFVTTEAIIAAAQRCTRFFAHRMTPLVEKGFYFCIAVLLLEGSDQSYQTVTDTLTTLSKSDTRALHSLHTLYLLCNKAGVDTTLLAPYNTHREEDNV